MIILIKIHFIFKKNILGAVGKLHDDRFIVSFTNYIIDDVLR